MTCRCMLRSALRLHAKQYINKIDQEMHYIKQGRVPGPARLLLLWTHQQRMKQPLAVHNKGKQKLMQGIHQISGYAKGSARGMLLLEIGKACIYPYLFQ